MFKSRLPQHVSGLLITLALVTCSLVTCSTPNNEQNNAGTPTTPCVQPKLVLQLTVDQLRGDFPTRFYGRYGLGGMRYLMDNGTYYSNAHFAHADTETAPGHATLVTGATPTGHGIVSGDWWDYEQRKTVHSVEDTRHPVMGSNGTRSPSLSDGRSPANLMSSTIGDEIALASENQAKVFAVAGKDRSAILPGGHTGKAWWLSNGQFTTSTYYYSAPPAWVKTWNGTKPAERYRGKSWKLLQDRSTYWRADRDDRPYEFEPRTLPKPYPSEDDKAFYRSIKTTIANDELVLDFTKELIEREQIGRRPDITDYLSVSLSSTDYIGHFWGPASLEAEDNQLRVDRIIADLLAYLDEKVGLENTLIVLSADHGAAEIPEYMLELGHAAGRIDAENLVQHIDTQLRSTFGGNQSLIVNFRWPYLYLKTDLIEKRGLNLEKAEKVAANAAQDINLIAYAVTRTATETGQLPTDNPLYTRIANNFYPDRAGHVHLVSDPYVILAHAPYDKFPSLHGSLWSYDTFVPVIFVGPGIPKGKRVSRPIGPHDIAPTLANYLGINPPSKSIGTPLKEVLGEE